MPIAIEPSRFCKHKIYHIILGEVKNNFLGAAVQIHVVIQNIQYLHLQSTPLHPQFDSGQGVESNYTIFYKKLVLGRQNR